MKLPSIIKNKWVIIGTAATVTVAVILFLVLRRKKKGGGKMSGKYFTISELCKARSGYDNTPTEEVKTNLQQIGKLHWVPFSLQWFHLLGRERRLYENPNR